MTVNQVNIIESQVFVYNLGTMYYIDDLLYPEMLESIKQYNEATIPPVSLTTVQSAETERIPIKPNEPVDSSDIRHIQVQTDVRSDDSENNNHNEDDDGEGEIITPRALPVHFLMNQP